MKVKRLILGTGLMLLILIVCGGGWLLIELQMQYLKKSQNRIAWGLAEYFISAINEKNDHKAPLLPVAIGQSTKECDALDRSCVALISQSHMDAQRIQLYKGMLRTVCYADENFAPNGRYVACNNSDFGSRVYLYQPDGTLAVTYIIPPLNP